MAGDARKAARQLEFNPLPLPGQERTLAELLEIEKKAFNEAKVAGLSVSDARKAGEDAKLQARMNLQIGQQPINEISKEKESTKDSVIPKPANSSESSKGGRRRRRRRSGKTAKKTAGRHRRGHRTRARKH